MKFVASIVFSIISTFSWGSAVSGDYRVARLVQEAGYMRVEFFALDAKITPKKAAIEVIGKAADLLQEGTQVSIYGSSASEKKSVDAKEIVSLRQVFIRQKDVPVGFWLLSREAENFDFSSVPLSVMGMPEAMSF